MLLDHVRETLGLTPARTCGLRTLAFAFIFGAICVAAPAQSTTTLVPSSYATSLGIDGGEPVASTIDILDQTGTSADMTKLLWLKGHYAGYQLFTLPSSITPSSITGILVKVNYMGPSHSRQVWTWQIFNWVTNSYVTIGDNSAITPALDWVNWTIFGFNGSGTLADYVRNSDKQIRVEILSNNAVDDTYIDYEAVIGTRSGSQAVSVTIVPTVASVQTGTPQQFSAIVTGSSNTAVHWQVNGVVNGNSTVGTISTSGLYTAPSMIPSPATVTVKAVSQADNSKSASAAATVTGPVAGVPVPIHGVTAEDTNDVRDPTYRAKLITSLNHLSVTPTTRIVYTPGDRTGYFAASTYRDATVDIKSAGYVLGLPVDSSSMKCFTPLQYLNRFQDYVQTLGDKVDIWEVGNEINGEWTFGKTKGCQPKPTAASTSQADVVTKMTQAYDHVKSKGKVAALTLYYNQGCGAPPANEMFTWTNANIPARMRQGLDYVLVSYYELDCSGLRPDWQSVFQQLATVFPNSKLGISEFGYSTPTPPSVAVRTDLINRYYGVRPSVSNYVGGGFYWEYSIDMVPDDPSPDSLWSVINKALRNQ